MSEGLPCTESCFWIPSGTRGPAQAFQNRGPGSQGWRASRSPLALCQSLGSRKSEGAKVTHDCVVLLYA